MQGKNEGLGIHRHVGVASAAVLGLLMFSLAAFPATATFRQPAGVANLARCDSQVCFSFCAADPAGIDLPCYSMAYLKAPWNH